MFNPESLLELLDVVSNPERAAAFSNRNKVGRDKVNGLIISTVKTSDMGHETAILDKNGTHPVQRYSDQIEAERGHKEWIEKAKTITTVIKLGYPGLVDDEEITLVRYDR